MWRDIVLANAAAAARGDRASSVRALDRLRRARSRAGDAAGLAGALDAARRRRRRALDERRTDERAVRVAAAGAAARTATSRVPGDKSIAHRALLLGALADGAYGGRRRSRAATTSAPRSTPCSALGAAAATDGDTVRVTRRAAASWARRRDVTARLRQLRHHDASRLGAGARGSGAVRRSTATARCGAGRWSASPSRCAPWARASRPRGGRPPVQRRRAAACAGGRRGRCRSRARR